MQLQAHHKAKQIFFLGLNYGIPLIAMSYILLQFTNLKASYQLVIQDLSVRTVESVVAVLLTMVVFTSINWYLEAFKWQQSIALIRPLSLKKALQQCLAGASAGIFTPGKAGDYVLKAFVFKKAHRPMVLVLNTFNNLMQLATTCIFGTVSLVLLVIEAPQLTELVSIEKTQIGLGIFGLVSITAIIIFKNRFKRHYKKLKSLLQKISFAMGLKIFLISVTRYLVFSWQFMLILWLLGSPLDGYLSFISLSAVYVINSVIPSSALSDVVVKSGLGIAIFGLFGTSAAIVLTATMLMWLSNHMTPALIGSVVLIKNKSLSLQ